MLHDYGDVHISQFSTITRNTVSSECFAVMSDDYV